MCLRFLGNSQQAPVLKLIRMKQYTHSKFHKNVEKTQGFSHVWDKSPENCRERLRANQEKIEDNQDNYLPDFCTFFPIFRHLISKIVTGINVLRSIDLSVTLSRHSYLAVFKLLAQLSTHRLLTLILVLLSYWGICGKLQLTHTSSSQTREREREKPEYNQNRDLSEELRTGSKSYQSFQVFGQHN